MMKELHLSETLISLSSLSPRQKRIKQQAAIQDSSTLIMISASNPTLHSNLIRLISTIRRRTTLNSRPMMAETQAKTSMSMFTTNLPSTTQNTTRKRQRAR